MTDPTYDPGLANRLRAYSQGGVRPVDALAIAEAAIAGRRARPRRLDIRLLAVAAVLVLGGSLAAAIAAGSRPMPNGLGQVVIAYSDGGPGALRSARRVDVASGAAADLVLQEPKVSVAPDGRHVAFHDAPDVHLVDARTGAGAVLKGAAAGRLRSPGVEGGAMDDTWQDFVWSPGGRWVSWMACASGGCMGTLGAADASRSNWIPRAGPDPVAVASAPGWGWPDDDHLLVFGHGEHLFATTSVAKGDGSDARPCVSDDDCHLHTSGWGLPGGTETVVTPDGITVAWDGWAIAGYATTPDDATAIVVLTAPANDPQNPSKQGRLWLARADGAKAQVDLGPYLARTAEPVFSPDGSRMVIAGIAQAQGGAPAVPAAFIVDLPSGRVIARLDDVALAEWSPDGERLALVRSSAPGRLEAADADGSNRQPVGPDVGGQIDQLVWVR